MKMVIFVFIVVVAAHACFVVPVDGVTGAARHIVFATCLAIVVHVTHGASITWLYFLLFFCKFFMVCFVVDLNVVVAGDLRHEFAQFAWGFPFRGPPGFWLCSSRLHPGNWCSIDNDCHCVMSIVVILTMFSQRLCCICRQGRLVAPRLISMVLLVRLEQLLSWEHFCPSQRWHWLCLWQSMMALIMPIAIDDVGVACCCLLRLCLVPTLASCLQLQLGFLIV